MASVNLVFNISSPASTGVVFTPSAAVTGTNPYSAAGSIPAGTVLGTVSVPTPGWQGALSLSGANATVFSLSGFNLTAAATLTAGSDAVTVTATP